MYHIEVTQQVQGTENFKETSSWASQDILSPCAQDPSAESDESGPYSHMFFFLRCISLSSSHLHVGLPIGLMPSESPPYTSQLFLLKHVSAIFSPFIY
jgi:hypothetical protein